MTDNAMVELVAIVKEHIKWTHDNYGVEARDKISCIYAKAVVAMCTGESLITSPIKDSSENKCAC